MGVTRIEYGPVMPGTYRHRSAEDGKGYYVECAYHVHKVVYRRFLFIRYSRIQIVTGWRTVYDDSTGKPAYFATWQHAVEFIDKVKKPLFNIANAQN